MFAQLGTIKFEGIKGFEAFARKREANYAQHALIENKPRLERVGTKLTEVNLTINLHTAFCTPEEELDKLDTARQNGEVLSLVIGTGEVYGNFVITNIGETVNKTDGNGAFVGLQLEVNLLEAVVNKAKAAAAAQRLKAFAIAPITARGAAPSALSTMPQAQIMKSIVNGKIEITKAQAMVKKLKQGYQNFDKAAKQIKRNIDKANSEFTKAKNMVLQNPVVLQTAANLSDILESAHSLGNNVLVTVQPLASVGALNTANDALVNHLPVLSTAASPVAALCAIRKVT